MNQKSLLKLLEKGFLIASLFLVPIGCIETDIEDPFPETLRIIEPEETFFVSGRYELMAEYTDDTGEPADAEILWESSNENVLQIEGNEAIGITDGQVFINASVGNLSETLLVNVEVSRELFQISNFVEILQVGTAFTFQATYMDESGTLVEINPNWSSSDEAIATVSNSGEVEGVAEGTVTITASTGSITDQITVELTNDPIMIDPEIRITSFSMFLSQGDNFLFQAIYFGENGQPDPDATIQWSSSNTDVLTIDNSGMATAQSGGIATVSASFGSVNASVEVMVEGSDETIRTGTLMGTGYNISGDFTLSVNSDGDLILSIENFVTAGPGPYFYLSNQSTNVANGVSLGDAKTNGNVEINVTAIDPDVELNSFQYLMIWCEPFSVRLGFGEFTN